MGGAGGTKPVRGSPVMPRSGVTGTARPTLRFAVPRACSGAEGGGLRYRRGTGDRRQETCAQRVRRASTKLRLAVQTQLGEREAGTMETPVLSGTFSTPCAPNTSRYRGCQSASEANRRPLPNHKSSQGCRRRALTVYYSRFCSLESQAGVTRPVLVCPRLTGQEIALCPHPTSRPEWPSSRPC